MTKLTMPEPGYKVSAKYGKFTSFTSSDPRAKKGDGLYTAEQMEAYKDACVRESTQWISVDDRLPDQGLLVLVYSTPQPGDWPGTVRIELDYICPDYEDWHNHSAHYEHYSCAALPEGSTGPSEKAPYTHWLDFPNPPQHDNEQGE